MSRIQDILSVASQRLVTIPMAATVVTAAKLLSERKAGLVVVCSPEGRMQGVVSKSDVVRQISHCQGCSCTTVVADVMSRDVVACTPDQALYDVWLLMKDRRLKQVPVADASRVPLGLLYASEALEVLMKEVEQQELMLRDYVMGIGYR